MTSERRVDVKVKYIGHGDPFLTRGKVYDVLDFDERCGDVDIIDDDGDKYFMFPEEYEVVEE